MSLVTPQRWEFWMGDVPMPDDCNSEQMWAMVDAMQKIEHQEWAVESIRFYQLIRDRWLPEYEIAKEYKDTHEDYAKKYANLADIIRMCDEQIEFWQKSLLGS